MDEIPVGFGDVHGVEASEAGGVVDKAVEAAFLTVYTRRPGAKEQTYFEERLHGTSGDERSDRLEDIFWALVNSTEFKWNH